MRARDRIFVLFFVLYTAGLLLWLAVGLEPAIVDSFPSLHERAHRAGGNPRPALLTATGQAFDPPVLVVQTGGWVTVKFTNLDEGRRHNVVLTGSAREPFLSGAVLRGVGTREYSFRAPSPGTYPFRCDVVGSMTGRLVVTTGAEGVDSVATTIQGWAGHLRAVADASHASEPPLHAALDYLLSALNLGLGLFLVRRRPRHLTARCFGVAMIGTAAAYNLQSHTALAVMPALDYALHASWHPVAGIAYVYALLTFPDGKLVPRRTRNWVRRLWGAATFFAIMFLLGAAGLIEPEPGAGHAAAFVVFFGVLVPVLGLASQAYRYRRAPTEETRQQSRVLLWALAPVFVIGLLFVVLGAPQTARVAFRVFQPVFILIPAALVVGILRYRLWDIDLVIRRTVVFGTLAAFITVVYVALVVGVGNALGAGREASAGLSVAAVTLVAIAFEPARERVQRFANRLVYGERATPYEVMAGFSSRMSATLGVDEVLPEMAEAAARGVGAVRSRVRIFLPERSVSWPDRGDQGGLDRSVTVAHGGEPVGEIAVSKALGDPLTVPEEDLLQALASQAGVALHNVRLTEELQARLDQIAAQASELAASRQRLVTARDAEHRRLEREISALVEPQIVRMAAALGAAESAGGDDRGALIEEAGAHLDGALNELQQLARGVFPPLLADHGVAAALEAQFRKTGMEATLHADEAMRSARFDRRAEAAVYFCCVEALREAGGPVSVRLWAEDGWLLFSVAGGRADVRAMADRVEALGGTLEASSPAAVEGRVPAQPPGPA